MRHGIRVAEPSDRERVVDTVVASFHDDPAFRWFFPTPESWRYNVRGFVGALFDSRVEQGATWVTAEIESVAMWSTPAAGALRSNLDALDADARARLADYNAATADGLPDGDFWYLGILATHPDHRGQRLGRTIMERGLRAADAAGHAAYLETTKPGNLELYGREGWEVTAETTFDTLTIWVMRHEGRS